jgi:sporulation protein YlmC with PRC-barrel domain
MPVPARRYEMPQAEEVAAWRGRRVVDPSGDDIGKLEDIYLDDESGEPEWALVATSLFAGRSPFVPLAGAEAHEDVIRVPFAKDQVKDAPSIKAGEELSQEQEAQLYAHYGLEYSFVPSGSGMPEGEPGTGRGSDAHTTPGGGGAADTAGAPAAPGAAGAAGAAAAIQPGSGAATTDDTAEAATADTPDGTASSGQPAGAAGPGAASAGAAAADEDDVRVRARAQPRERVRLRKYLVTEHVTKTVPVQREEVRVEREPIEGDEADAQDVGAAGDQEVTLTQEEAVVEPTTRSDQQSE